MHMKFGFKQPYAYEKYNEIYERERDYWKRENHIFVNAKKWRIENMFSKYPHINIAISQEIIIMPHIFD